MKKLLTLALVLLLINGCQDPVEAPYQQNNNHNNPDIQENVVAILEENSEIISDETQLEQGIYVIEFNNNLPDLKVDDIIVGNEGKGFLRKITSVTKNGNTVTIESVQATLEELFVNQYLSFHTDISQGRGTNNSLNNNNIVVNYVAPGVSYTKNNLGLVFKFNETELYKNGALEFKLKSGSLTFNPNFNFDLDIEDGSIEKFTLGAENASLVADASIEVGSSGKINLSNSLTTLAEYDRYIYLWAGFVPVVIVVNIRLDVVIDVNIEGGITFDAGFTNESLVNLGVKYENDQWSHTYETANHFKLKKVNADAVVAFNQELAIEPVVSFDIYNVAGPYVNASLKETYTAAVNPHLDRNSELKIGAYPYIGADAEIFGKNIGDFHINIDPLEKILYRSPTTLTKISGDEQEGMQGKELEESIIVKVTDTLDNPLDGIPVYFTPEATNGSVDNAIVKTDDDGKAEVKWTLGEYEEDQILNVKVKKANGDDLTKLQFTAKAEMGTIELSGDLDFGNVQVNNSKDKTLTITNNSLETVNVSSINFPNGYSLDWTIGTIPPESSIDVTVTFSPTLEQEYAGDIIVNNDLDYENNKITVTGTGTPSESIDITGIWITDIEITDCNALGSSNDQDCVNHTSWHDMEMELAENLDYNYCSSNSISCGYALNERFLNSEVFIERSYNFDGSELIIKIRTYSTSGYFFDTRTFEFIGTYDENTDSFSGTVTQATPGGLWKNNSVGNMTLTRK